MNQTNDWHKVSKMENYVPNQYETILLVSWLN